MKKRTHLEFVDELKLIQPDLVVLGEFVNMKTPILCKDKYGEILVRSYHLLKGSVPTISTALNKTKYWINQAKEIYKDKYIYDKVVYINSKRKVIITCPIHGDFLIKPSAFLEGHRCKKCHLDTIKISNNDFLNRISRFNFDFKMLNPPNGIRGDIFCETKYGIIKTCAANLLKNQKPNITNAVDPTEYFISQLKEINGDRYYYHKIKYINSFTNVELICKIHGSFYMRPKCLLSGRNCPKCGRIGNGGYSRSDFIRRSNNRQCTLYKIKCYNDNESFYKIGITSNSVPYRFSSPKKMPYNYEVISTIHGEAGVIWDMEVREHRRHKEYGYTPILEFKGMHECFHKLI